MSAFWLTFWGIFGTTLCVLGLSLATRQREAALAVAPLALAQIMSQWAVATLDAPASLVPAMLFDMMLALQYTWMWSRRPQRWLVAAFFVQATACILHVTFATLWEWGVYEVDGLFFGYGLSLNILALMLCACIAWPGAQDVANHLRDMLRRARPVARLALRHQKRG